MKTLNVHIKNFKNIENFTADFNGQNVIILGDNEVGKSSLLQFIKIAIGDQSCIPPNAEGSGEVVMDMNGKPVTFKLNLVDGKAIIKVNGEGIAIDNNKGAIASLVGANKVNIDEFIALSRTTAGRKKQVEDFKNLLDSDVVAILNKCEANVKNLYDERTQTNRDVKNLEGSIKLNPLYNHSHELNKFQPVDVAGTMAEFTKATEHNANVTKINQGVSDKDKQVLDNQKQVAELQAKIDAYNANSDLLIKQIADGKKWLETNKPIDTSKFDEVIQSATETNKKAQQAEQLQKEIDKLKVLSDSAGEQTVLIEVEKQCILDTIRDLDSPVEGVSFDEEQLLYKDVPVHPDSLSTSTIAELGVKLKRAENPNIPILLECSESWGQKRFDWLKDWAKRDDFQFIAERVESGKDLEIQIIVD